MILAMLISAALANADAAAEVVAAPPEAGADALIAQATQWLLAGEDLPVDMNVRLARLPPAERIRVLVFLRRSGLFTGPDWPIDKLLAPATAGFVPQEPPGEPQ